MKQSRWIGPSWWARSRKLTGTKGRADWLRMQDCAPECPLWVISGQTVPGQIAPLSAIVQKRTSEGPPLGSEVMHPAPTRA